MSPVQDYIDAQAEPAKSAVERVYDIARKTVPDATEGIKYGMPALVYKDYGLISVMVTKKHIAIYPYSGAVPGLFDKELTAGGFEFMKGTIKFQADHQLPEELIEKIVLATKAQTDAKS